MAITLSDNIFSASPKILDWRYGPWTGITHANTMISSPFWRAVGLTVGILSGNSLNEYWYYSGITDSDLILKIIGSSRFYLINIKYSLNYSVIMNRLI